MTNTTRDPLRILVVGVGNMGRSHARAYAARKDAFSIVGLVSRGAPGREALARELDPAAPPATFGDFDAALAATRPDAVCISTYPDTHAAFAQKALRAGAHVFVEKPLAPTVEESRAVVAAARESKRQLVVGYILRQHPSWAKFIEIARGLGKPLVMRMNLNQQSHGATWKTHQALMQTMSPIVDCGVHYVDVMCQMTRAKPVRVHAIGARLSDEIAPDMYNYGQLQVMFDDGSIGWYEAGWGPMISEEAYFVKDVMGPRGCVSIIASKAPGSDDVDSHSNSKRLRVHQAAVTADGKFARPDEIIDNADEPDHQGLCDREQEYFRRAIVDQLDLTDHLDDAVNSLRIVLAADQSVRERRVVEL